MSGVCEGRGGFERVPGGSPWLSYGLCASSTLVLGFCLGWASAGPRDEDLRSRAASPAVSASFVQHPVDLREGSPPAQPVAVSED
jgi:hypothetical protein